MNTIKKRDAHGRFIKDQVNLSNDFKGLEINQDRPVKPVNYVQIIIIMVLIFGMLVLADKCNVIELTNKGGF